MVRATLLVFVTMHVKTTLPPGTGRLSGGRLVDLDDRQRGDRHLLERVVARRDRLTALLASPL